MEQMMQQIREMMSVAEALISTNPKEAQAHYTKMEPLWTRRRAERKEDIKDKSHRLGKNIRRPRKKEGRHESL
jgi:phosphoenolpyruvate-protein kinase (PTS system EI component)